MDAKTTVRAAELCLEIYNDICPSWAKDYGDLRCGSVIMDSGIALMVYRGTANFANAERDIWAVPKKSRDGHWTHAGVVDGLEVMIDPLLNLMRTHTGIIIPIGHSYGGGLAALAARLTGGRCITEGAMRISPRFSSPTLLHHDRYVNDDDGIPDLLYLTYHFPDPRILLDDGDNGILGIKDHHAGVYLERIKKRMAPYVN